MSFDAKYTTTAVNCMLLLWNKLGIALVNIFPSTYVAASDKRSPGRAIITHNTFCPTATWRCSQSTHHFCLFVCLFVLGTAATKAEPSGDEPAVGRDDDLCAGAVCGVGHLSVAWVAHIPHLHRTNDHRVLSESGQPLEGQTVWGGEGSKHHFFPAGWKLACVWVWVSL